MYVNAQESQMRFKTYQAGNIPLRQQENCISQIKSSFWKKKRKYFRFFFLVHFSKLVPLLENVLLTLMSGFLIVQWQTLWEALLAPLPPRQKRNVIGATLISMWNSWTFERSFYFVFSCDVWFWNVGGPGFLAASSCSRLQSFFPAVVRRFSRNDYLETTTRFF